MCASACRLSHAFALMYPSQVERCFYCSAEKVPLTEEHVISLSLGCQEVLPDFICKRCNDIFGHDLEGKLANGLSFFRNFFRIPGRNNRIPDFNSTGVVNDREIPRDDHR